MSQETPVPPIGDPAPRQVFPFSYKGLAIALVKAQGLHRGIWRVYVKFGQPGGLNARHQAHGNQVFPSVVVPILEVGLVADTELSDLSVDAAVINPESRIVLPAVH